MARKRKGSVVGIDWDDTTIEDGYIVIRPVVRIWGPFDVNFGRLFVEYVKDKICDLIFDLSHHIPKSDSAPSEEVQ